MLEGQISEGREGKEGGRTLKEVMVKAKGEEAGEIVKGRGQGAMEVIVGEVKAP